jgi:flagellar hook protein FlgE
MLDLMSQAKNAIEAYNQKLRATSSNVNSMSVPGYKRIEVSFEEIFNNVISEGYAATAEGGGVNPSQTGGTANIGKISMDFTRGDVQASSSPFAIYPSGMGLFIVSDDGGKTFKYNRSGDFNTDSQGYLSDVHGNRVYGFARNNGVTQASQLVAIKVGDLPQTISGTSPLDDATYTYTLSFGENGELQYYRIPDPLNATDPEYLQEPLSSFQIAMVTFNNPSGLIMSDGTTFTETAASGKVSNPMAPGGAAGTVKPRAIEASNVFYISETIDAMEIQRAMSGALSMVRLVNDIISQFMNRVS